MKKHSLSAQKRDLVGRKVKQLRKQGILPASLYGKKVKSASLSVKLDDFEKVYKEAGESGLVDLKVDSEVKPVLIHNVQKDPVKGFPLHVEFFQVDLKAKVQTRVPIELVGESAAVAQKQGVLLTILDEIEVEALPTDLPEKITVDVSGLAAVDQEIKVSDLNVSSGVAVLTDAGQTLVKVGALVTKQAEAEVAAEEAAKAAAAAEAATEAKAEVPAAQEKPAEPAAKEEKTPEEKKE